PHQFTYFSTMTKLRGVAAALTTFTIWGVSPLYWRELGHVPELQVLMHRILWSFVLCATLTVAFARDWSVLATAFGHAKTTAAFRRHGIAALFISGNWAVYVWAVNAGFVSQAGLGDYILPLITVLLGVVFLRERLHQYQWAAIGLATLGLCVISVGYGVFPWVSLVLALCEALYSFAKTSPLVRLNAIQGVAFEMSMLVVPAVAYLVFVEVSEGNRGVFGHGEIHTDLLLVGSGVVTALPLVTLSYAVQHLPLTVVGVLVYVTPTIVVLLAAFAFHEHFSAVTLLGFGLVWASLVIFSAQSYMGYRDIHKQDQTTDPAIVLTPANDLGLSNSPNLQQSHHIPVDNYHALHSSKAKSPTLLHEDEAHLERWRDVCRQFYFHQDPSAKTLLDAYEQAKQTVSADDLQDAVAIEIADNRSSPRAPSDDMMASSSVVDLLGLTRCPVRGHGAAFDAKSVPPMHSTAGLTPCNHASIILIQTPASLPSARCRQAVSDAVFVESGGAEFADAAASLLVDTLQCGHVVLSVSEQVSAELTNHNQAL
ncbi:hypothetical protein DYB37_012678, partial [Aphanomyces astaci]